jgi:hypothetical protein
VIFVKVYKTVQSLSKYDHIDWDFRDADTKEDTHCFHPYPARMVPQIARTLLHRYGVTNGWLLDPYCGSGTSLVEATIFGTNAVGCDVNPLAQLIAAAKTSVISLQTLDLYLKDLFDRIFASEFTGEFSQVVPPDFPNRDYWFSPEVSRKLAFLRQYVNSLEDEALRNFFSVAFAETVRECSYTRNGEFKLFRMPPAQLINFNPDVFRLFRGKLERNRRGLEHYLAKRGSTAVFVNDVNLAEGHHPTPMPLQGFDMVLTSPPYGDSGTTVAYGQFSRLASEWLDLRGARTVDRRAMGGQLRHEERDFGPVSEQMSHISAMDGKRGRQVASFYVELARSIETVVSLLARQAVVCYVVGNRRVKGVTLSTDAFIIHSFAQHGLRHEKTFVRSIPNKHMPSRNSPSNVPGETDATMSKEYIVICRR